MKKLLYAFVIVTLSGLLSSCVEEDIQPLETGNGTVVAQGEVQEPDDDWD